MSILVIDALSGCSGDMFVAALCQLADKADEISTLPGKLGFKHVRVEWSEVQRSSLACHKCDFIVTEHHHGHEQHTHADHHHDHHHRHLSDIQKIIQNAELPSGCKERALDMFQRLGEVEAAAHGIAIEKVHFHEVGAIDSIMDIVATAYLLDALNIQASYCSTICVGHGQVKTAHGLLPIPAPATERLLHHYRYMPGELAGEWCTPTGAVILAHLKIQQQIPALSYQASAYGAGGKDPAERPNAVRLRLAQENTAAENTIHILQCNVDDMPSELLGADFIQGILDAGAMDVAIRPQIMKKGRPGHLIEVLCPQTSSQNIAAHLCQHSTTIGVRIMEAQRYTLEREMIQLETPYGAVNAKLVTLPDGSKRCMPEYEDCATIAAQSQVSVLSVYQAAQAAQ